MKKRLFTYTDVIFYCVVFVASFLLSRQYLQVHEDLGYCFSSADGTPITSFLDAIRSQAWDYMHGVARFSVHTFVQYFCSMDNKLPFFIISAAMFVLLNVGLLYISRIEFGIRETDKYLILLWLFLMAPLVGVTFWGHIAFVVNYLWAAALNVLFISMFLYEREHKDKCSALRMVILAVISIFIGGFQESFSICICGSLFFYALFNRKSLTKKELVLILAYIIGTCTLLFAPGNISRVISVKSASDMSFIMKICYNFGRVLFGYWQIFIYFALAMILFLFKRKPLVGFLQKNVYYILALCIFILFTTFIAYTARHQLMCLSIILLILTLKAVYTWRVNDGRGSFFINIIVSVLLLCVYTMVYGRRNQLCDVYDKFETSARNENDTIALAGDFIYFDKVVMKDSPFRDFLNLVHTSSQVYYKDGIRNLSRYLTDGRNLNYKTVVLSDTPKNIIKQCTQNNEISPNVYALSDYLFIVKCTKEISESSVIRIHKEPIAVKSHLLNIIHSDNTIQLRVADVDMQFVYDGIKYLFLVGDRENNGYRISTIRIDNE